MSSNLFKATVNEHLESLPESMQSRLYEAPATCLSIYRLLPPIAKFFIMSMLFSERPVLLRDLDKWCKPGTRKVQFESLKRLKSLHLVLEDKLGTYITLHPTFRKNFRACLTGSQQANAFGNLANDSADDNAGVTISFLDSFALNKWETILHFMVGTDSTPTPSASVLSLLRSGGLMETSASEDISGLRISNTGFQFLLQDSNAQIWTILLEYLKISEELNMDPVDVLNFIFILGSLELGKGYIVSSLSTTQQNMLADLKDYGLIYQKSSGSGKFYPTRLATTLTSDSVALKSPAMAIEDANNQADSDSAAAVAAAASTADSSSSSGSIILETNFKLYAYTNSPLEIAILNLFVQLKTRFANMVCGQVTRESIRKALYNGITSQQIIKFLETHAHPQLKILAREKLDKKIEFDTNNNINTAGGAPQSQQQRNEASASHRLEILPPTVVDQIKLWQLELDRIQTFEGYLFKDFASQQEYDVLSNYASEIGVLIWADKGKKKFFITEQGKSQVVDFANRKLQR
ncbi:general transcription and DNA repair factor IIH subunit Tfb2p [[Candida] railenensis]|uniref:RNA polymerase II transcription factor B subunit 2 n=1 Tax=[Candida] railenensis TaxID=45579 RepID=A0A9P0QS97_9ASCO|nr:general transcription and DNA repair factor IIH subunit Tfb2p [[Candida] railenensis]